MSHEISNSVDLIDSRDVIARIEELQAEHDDNEDNSFDEEKVAELAALKALAEEAEGYAADWYHGETLIRYSYFTEYAQDLADDLGAISNTATWPNNCIDWEEAARQLKEDYTEVDFDGVAYYIR